MPEYIDRAVAVSQANFIHGRWDNVYVSADALMAIPAADVIPVTHSEWDVEVGMNYHTERICPVCKKVIKSNFWEYCGAKMDGGEKMTTELKVMVGIPGSGKSTWVKQEVARIEEEHRTTCVVSRDFVRQSILTDRDSYFDKEVEVFDEFVRQINEAMELGIDVVFADATHISPASRAKLLGRLIADPHTKLTFEVIDVPVETALERNAQRTGVARIPDSAIKKMKKGFSIPTEKEFPKTNWGFSNIEVRVHH